MIGALDVHYGTDGAHAAALLFEHWQASAAVAAHSAMDPQVADYQPGHFYLRELGPLLTVVRSIPVPVHTWVIDGYCQLSPAGAPGLGAHLHTALPPSTCIVGVAKRRYREATHAIEVLRGDSRQPLFVTAIGMQAHEAARLVAGMAGPHRMPLLLKAVDQLARRLL